MTKFADCFWGGDFNSTAGFDILCKRMRDGRQMCHDFEEFIRQRADAEEKYGKALIKLAESGKGKEEIGSLRDSWEVLKTETENIGKAHLNLSQQLIEELGKTVRDFQEIQREKRKRGEDLVKRAQKNKKNCFDFTSRSKKTYEVKCREFDAADEALKKSVHSVVSKDEEKLRARLGKAKTTVEQADTAYQTSVRMLEDARIVWEKEMEACCNSFQSLEEERIAFLRNAMWIYTNTSSLTCVKVDAICEGMRKSLEKCAVDSDINFFITLKRTGSERPARIEYENYYLTQTSQKISPSGALNVSVPVPGSFQHLQTKDPVSSQGSVSQRPVLRRPPMNLPEPRAAAPIDESMYSTVDERNRPREVRAKDEFCRAQFDYESQGDQELTFSAGDLIKVCFKEDDTWWCGELNGRRGMFPKAFVEPV